MRITVDIRMKIIIVPTTKIIIPTIPRKVVLPEGIIILLIIIMITLYLQDQVGTVTMVSIIILL
jgi:hypothetical protein